MRFFATSFVRSVNGVFCLFNLRKGSVIILEGASDFLQPMFAGEDIEVRGIMHNSNLVKNIAKALEMMDSKR